MTEDTRADRIAGIALIAASLISMLAMAHHPTSLDAGALIQIVHGVMLFVVAVWIYGFARFAQVMGIGRPAVLAGLVAYAIGAAAGIGAGTINGFVAPAVALHQPAVSHDLFVLAWEANQALARIGVVAIGGAYALWALALWPRARVTAISGMLVGGVTALLLIGGWIDMHLHFAILVYAAEALWAAWIGWLLLRGRLSPDVPSKAEDASPNLG